ncbi:MAG TPA: DUF420 domain-containing protein, partial [Pirellulaceae bacterium]|nr:DUF420 domain-containing protein [Pirellulaceae bacterium]
MPGILPFRGSLMLDVVCLAMVAITIALGISIYQIRYRRRERLHRAMQLTLASILAVAVVAFEIDLRFFTNWRDLAEASPFYASGWVDRALWLHLVFAIPTPIAWTVLIISALRHYPALRNDAKYWRRHRRYGWLGTWMMIGTAVTGWLF